MMIRTSLNPYIRARFNTTQIVMLDVVIALLPLVFVSWVAYGMTALHLIGVAVGTALLSDFIFSLILLRKKDTVLDGSAIVTGLLLAFTLSPATPLYIVAFGSFSAILFGKIVWGGLGKNRFNPALVGREFMTVFFASVMSSPNIWKNNDLINTTSINLLNNYEHTFLSDYLNGMLYKTTGALGEYSIVCIALGGVYLLLRNRISWHIPLSLLGSFVLMLWLLGFNDLKFSTAGILLGTLFMATDMPSSPTTSNGKLFYGAMIGICLFAFIKGGVRFEYTSFAILLMNGFSHRISMVFRPRAWGEEQDYKRKTEEIFVLVLQILTVAFAVLTLYWNGLAHYVILIYIVYIIFKFNFSFTKSTNKYV